MNIKSTPKSAIVSKAAERIKPFKITRLSNSGKKGK